MGAYFKACKKYKKLQVVLRYENFLKAKFFLSICKVVFERTIFKSVMLVLCSETVMYITVLYFNSGLQFPIMRHLCPET